MVKSIVFLNLILIFIISVNSQIPDGFLYGGDGKIDITKSIVIEAFLDPVCPDSRDSWPPLKKALHHYGSRVSLVVHTFPLPYHDNAFTTSRALHIVNKLNSSATFRLLEAFFDQQNLPKAMLLKLFKNVNGCVSDTPKVVNFGESNTGAATILESPSNIGLRSLLWGLVRLDKFYGQATFHLSKASVVDEVAKFTSKEIGNSNYAAVKAGFTDPKTDQATRISFKYGCVKGVYGAPFFFVNGFPLPDGGSPLDYKTWRDVLDPLISPEEQLRAENLNFFL